MSSEFGGRGCCELQVNLGSAVRGSQLEHKQPPGGCWASFPPVAETRSQMPTVKAREGLFSSQFTEVSVLTLLAPRQTVAWHRGSGWSKRENKPPPFRAV